MSQQTQAPRPAHEALARLVKESGLSYREIHERSGVHPANLTAILAGRKRPTTRTVESLLTALSKSWSDLD